MKTIYLDSEFKCHVNNNEDGTLVPYETEFFDDKCDTFIEGYRIIPEGESWTREDGDVFEGYMVAPHMNYDILEAAQREYEQKMSIIYREALRELGIEI